MEKKDFVFADFKVSSQDWNSTVASKGVINGCSDNGREFWSSEEEEKEESK